MQFDQGLPLSAIYSVWRPVCEVSGSPGISQRHTRGYIIIHLLVLCWVMEELEGALRFSGSRTCVTGLCKTTDTANHYLGGEVPSQTGSL